MEKLPNNFCWRPFTQINLKENTHRPCCFFQGNIQNDQDFNKEIRDSILANKWHDGCIRCKTLEQDKNTKKRSFRLLYNDHKDINLVLQNKFSAKVIEIVLDKTCNFACITCNSNSSSKWHSENLRMSIEDNIKIKPINMLPYKQHSLWENAETCIIYGGEPLYSKNTLALLKFLTENKFSEKLCLTFYTNGSIINDEIADLLQTFKSCKIKFSVDSIYDRFHVIRWPGDYEIVKDNVKKISQFKNTSLSITYTYSILNATNFIEDYKVIKNELSENIHLNVVNYPKIYAARNFSSAIKQKLISEYENESTIDRNTIEIITGELKMPQFYDSLKELIDQLKLYDLYRKTDSSILFPPEVWSLTDK